eukprot:TRINITY_DN51_c0_g1_i1.p1 TRINITY_DN51_c0_g1~~TRINITY_DN51_c0_g1_i1.p1  ORF type:complete len:620 (-),score=183.55 TRINITY_DN51_c0_g1_i1:638-2440(-)
MATEAPASGIDIPFDLASTIANLCAQAATAAGITPFSPEVAPADPKFGDYQANGCLAAAKAAKAKPRELAEKIIANLPADAARWFTTAIAGPGFINFTVKPESLVSWLKQYCSKEALSKGAAASCSLSGQHWVVDYSSPNTAKQMHVGHLRSAVIGEAICRLLEFVNVRVTRDNHIGDWGTQFGKLIWAYKRELNADALKAEPIEEFERLYKVGNSAATKDESVMEEARAELVKLQKGDEENIRIWKHINEVSMQAFQVIYDQLGIKHDLILGESFYNDKVDQVYEELTKIGLAQVSEGALIVLHPDHPRFCKQPFMVRKRDGASNYASTDLATALYRTEVLKCDGAAYVIDSRQADHCQQLFLTAKKWFEATGRKVFRMEHTMFGTVTGPGGTPLQTRSGDNVRLKTLLQEAVDASYTLVCAKNDEAKEEDRLSEDERRQIAQVVGIDSVQYSDLSQNRTSDYEFSLERMISLQGNTAPYLLYAVARICSIFAGLKVDPTSADAEAGASLISTPTEINLARKLVKFADVLQTTIAQLKPHFLCTYLYELAGEFSGFYKADRVNIDDAPVRARRVMLCARTLMTLQTGLGLLGLKTLQRM